MSLVSVEKTQLSHDYFPHCIGKAGRVCWSKEHSLLAPALFPFLVTHCWPLLEVEDRSRWI